MIVDYKTAQIKGPFEAGVNVFDNFSDLIITKKAWIQHVGIQAMPGSIVVINGEEIEIGKNGIYEVGEKVKVKSLYFKEDRGVRTYVEYVLKYN